jgi:hypothetical protein
MHNYHTLSPSTDSSSADESTFHHHDHSFGWMEEKLKDHKDSGKGITYWKYGLCYDTTIETFGFSIKLATATLDVFIRSHTRRMHVDRLDTSKFPSISSMFPLERLQHFTIYIPTAPINKSDYKRINALTAEIPQLHLSFPGLTSLKIEINWAKRFGSFGGPPFTNLDPEYLYYLHRDMFELCLKLRDAAKHIEAVALQSGEQITFCGDFQIDWVTMEKALLFPFTQTQDRWVNQPPTSTGTSLAAFIRDWTAASTEMDEETGQEEEMFEILPYEAQSPSGIPPMIKGKTGLHWQ